MKRQTINKINSMLENVDSLNKLLALEGSVSVSISRNDNDKKIFISSSAELDFIRPIIIAYREQLMQELKNLGFEAD